MIDPNAPAYPHPEYVVEERDKARVYVPQPGMTIRATMAMHAMHGILASAEQDSFEYEDEAYMHANWVPQVAVSIADALIAELNKTEVNP